LQRYEEYPSVGALAIIQQLRAADSISLIPRH
jgi:hypothetical protein